MAQAQSNGGASGLYGEFVTLAPFLQRTGFEESWLRDRGARAWARELIDVLDALDDGNMADADPGALRRVAKAMIVEAEDLIADSDDQEMRERYERSKCAGEMVLAWVELTGEGQ